MAHYARIDNGKVTRVIVSSNDTVGDIYPESESVGQAFIASLGLEGQWPQTSYNRNFRGTYAGIGYDYDALADEFIPPQPQDGLSRQIFQPTDEGLTNE